MTRVRLAIVAVTIASIAMWVLVERTFSAIGDGLRAAVEVSQVSANAAGSVDELSTGLSTLIGSVDQLAGSAKSLAVDASVSANSVADAANGSVGKALESTGKTAGRLAPTVKFVEGLTGSKGAGDDLATLSKSLAPVPKELDGIAQSLHQTGKSLIATGESLAKVQQDLKRTRTSVDKGRAALDELPGAAHKAEAAAAGPLRRLRFNLWLWRIAIAAIWVAAVAALTARRGRVATPIH